MAKRYNLGNKARVIKMMAMCAIRDQQALIEALTPARYCQIDDDTKKSIDESREWIADFKRIAASVESNS